MIEISTLKPGEAEQWDAHLAGNQSAIFDHSIAYRDLLAAELGCEAEYLVAREAGEIRGVLPIMWAAEPEGRVANSLPYFGSTGGPVSPDPAVHEALIEAWNERAADPGTVAATMVENPFLAASGGADLTPPIHEFSDERISQFTPLPAAVSSEARNNVARAERRGVTVELDNTAIAEVWRIHDENMRALTAPARSRRFLEALTGRLEAGEGFDIWVARVDGVVAAALLVVRFNGVSEYFTSGTHEGYRWHNPHPALLHAALVHEAENGSRIWNWGGTQTQGMDGVYRFKRKWGARERRYRYFVRVNDRSLLEAQPQELIDRFPGFYIVPFSALRAGVA